MNLKENVDASKAQIKESINQWIDEKLSAMGEGNPRIKAVTPHLRRGIDNFMYRNEKMIDEKLDNVMLFITDRDGNLTADMIMDDGLKLFQEMDNVDFSLAGMQGHAGKGAVSIDIPDNFITDLVFGKNKTVKLTAEDLLELKEIILNN